MKKILLVSAAPFECFPTAERLQSRGILFEQVATGIGALAAAASAREVAEKARGKDVIFIGTAGTFRAFNAPWLCTAQKVAWMPACERMGLAYGIPRGVIHSVDMPTPGVVTTGLPAMTVLCSPSISLQDAFAPAWQGILTPENCLENLELYSCMPRILEAARSVEVILGITNAIGASAHEQWNKWHKEAAAMTAAHIERSLCNSK